MAAIDDRGGGLQGLGFGWGWVRSRTHTSVPKAVVPNERGGPAVKRLWRAGVAMQLTYLRIQGKQVE